MSRIEAYPMTHIREFINPKDVYVKLMSLVIKLAEYGLIHGDFNEFNLMINDNEEITLIDFPQMISIDHPEANYFFNRDVDCIQTYFDRKYNLQFEDKPKLSEDIERVAEIDKEVKSSVFMREALGEDQINTLDLVEIANMPNEGEGDEAEGEGETEETKEEIEEGEGESKVQEVDQTEDKETEVEEGDKEQEGEGEIDETGRWFGGLQS